MVLLQVKDPLELFVKRREFHPSYGILSRCEIAKAVESNVKTNSFLPFVTLGTICEKKGISRCDMS